jgi:hypothetical protein
VFVVDDLLGWLVGRLADAGYQKLTTLLRGSDQARALKEAVTAAVQATVREIGLSDREGAERVAEQINKAFRRRDPVPLPPGQPTLLEALQAGIAGQLSALDDAGQPSVSLPGVPVSDVAATLTGHLVREITLRGARGGPLTPLAGQLNDDLTHAVTRPVTRIRDRPARRSASAHAVMPLAQVGVQPFKDRCPGREVHWVIGKAAVP